MRQYRAWFVRLGGFFRRNHSERDLVADIESHLRMHIEDNLGAGMSTSEARREALMKLGEGRWPSPTRIASSTLGSLWKGHSGHGFVSAPDFHDWHDQSTAFEAMAYYQDDDVPVTAGPLAEYAHVADVTPEFFFSF
jgi:hypothetical protein